MKQVERSIILICKGMQNDLGTADCSTGTVIDGDLRVRGVPRIPSLSSAAFCLKI